MYVYVNAYLIDDRIVNATVKRDTVELIYDENQEDKYRPLPSARLDAIVDIRTGAVNFDASGAREARNRTLLDWLRDGMTPTLLSDLTREWRQRRTEGGIDQRMVRSPMPFDREKS